MNSEKGITLITLVITIIVLMILTFTISVNIEDYTLKRAKNEFETDLLRLNEEINQYYSREKKLPIINKPTIAKCPGTIDKPKFTALSAPPLALTAPENAPAHKKIKHIVMMLSSPTLFAIIFIFSSNVFPLYCNIATISAIKNATIAGIA